MKNAFIFMVKVFANLEIFTFLSWFFGYVEKWLEKKTVRIISKFMTSHIVLEIITIYILTDISGSETIKNQICPVKTI